MKLPILIIIPHGGYRIPDELAESVKISDFNLFIEADTCANDLFSFSDICDNIFKSDISRFLIDLDRSYSLLPPKVTDGVIKQVTFNNHEIFNQNIFPDKTAIPNILKRYYFPFLKKIESVLANKKIDLILEMHTMAPIGPANSKDSFEPRPLFLINNSCEINLSEYKTSTDKLAKNLITLLTEEFKSEDQNVAGIAKIDKYYSTSYITGKIADKNIPIIKLSMSKSLFLNDQYFSDEYLKIDPLRIKTLKTKLSSVIKTLYLMEFNR